MRWGAEGLAKLLGVEVLDVTHGALQSAATRSRGVHP
jgi:hypothetical protein